MKLRILFGQRKENYEGQYGPEAILCWDEFCIDENPAEFDKQVDTTIDSLKSDFSSFKIIDIEVNQEKIRQMLSASIPVLPGRVVASE